MQRHLTQASQAAARSTSTAQQTRSLSSSAPALLGLAPRVARTSSSSPSFFRPSSCASKVSACVKSVPLPTTNRKALKQQHRLKNETLRRAIELYHLTPHFLPTPDRLRPLVSPTSSSTLAVPAPSSTEYNSALDNAIYTAILNTSSVSRNTANVVPRSLNDYSRVLSNRAAARPNDGSGDEISLAMENNIHARTFADDILTQTTFMTKKEREAASAAASAAALKAKPSRSVTVTESSSATLEAFTDDDLKTYQKRHNAGPAGYASEHNRHSGAERLSSLDRILPGANPWYKNQGLDSRSARVRDAIFGTINGELPGLEVVRERISKMQRPQTHRKAGNKKSSTP